MSATVEKCIYCAGDLEDGRHALPNVRCADPDDRRTRILTGRLPMSAVPYAREFYFIGYQVGRDRGDREGFRRGYVYGHHAGEHQARLADDAFIDAIARRIRVLDDLESAVSESVRSTIARMSAHAYRARKDGEPS